MAKPPKLDEFGLRRREHWPKFAPEVQAQLRGWFAFMRDEAVGAFERSAAIAAIAQEDLGSADNARWWSYVVRTIDWMTTRIDNRQKCLEVMLAIAEGRYKEHPCEQATLSAPAESSHVCESGAPADRPAVAGTKSGAISEASSPKPRRKASKR